MTHPQSTEAIAGEDQTVCKDCGNHITARPFLRVENRLMAPRNGFQEYSERLPAADYHYECARRLGMIE